MSDIEVNLSFLNRYSQVGFNRFKRQPNLAIVHKVKAVKVYSVLSENGYIPSVDFLHNDKVIDFLNLFGSKPAHHPF